MWEFFIWKECILENSMPFWLTIPSLPPSTFFSQQHVLLFKTHWVHSVLPVCAWVWTNYWRPGVLLGAPSTKKTDSSPQQPSVTNSFTARDRSLWGPLPFILGFLAWSCEGLINAITIAMCSWVQWPYNDQKMFHSSHALPQAFNFFFCCPLSTIVLKPWYRCHI